MNHIPIHARQFIKWNAHILTFLINIFIWFSGCSACSNHIVILCSKRVSTRVRERFRLLGVTFGFILVLSTWFTPALYFDKKKFVIKFMKLSITNEMKEKIFLKVLLTFILQVLLGFPVEQLFCGNDKS